jgi:hypothetical protein
MIGQIIGLVFTFGLSAAILESQNRQWTRDVKKRKKTIERKRIEESRRSGVLRSTRREKQKVGRNLNNNRKQNTNIQKKAINTEVNRDNRQGIRNNYRDRIIPNLKNRKNTLQNELNDITDEYNVSDTKNMGLLSVIVDKQESIRKDKLNVFGKTQQVHDQINKQNHYLEQTFQGLTQKRINLDRRSTYEDHIKMEYLLANVALWYVYYILLALLFFMYRKQENLKEPRTIVMMIGLLLFPYWMIILEVIIDIIVNMPIYAKQFAETLSRIPNATNKLFESLF